ncbi:SusC/RagA family TonB-linked outer membrane protein [Catalinimonas niigatensis]|uniref:SusC/RagA family TonB-linked outer membrane protein n=1 Tax=Catalinimonas niigatensis TaxID=1397264 RepID=UPI002666E7E7|nr:TonB-dependent receptor [Catalinimonas niigatensis]WPP49194.1 TonB-dependent receptor [Catalinimonas niigatensis]
MTTFLLLKLRLQYLPERYILIFLCLIFSLNLYAQDQTVQGKVTDASGGDPIPGANIVVKGTNTGTVTDIEGNYRINVPNSESVLVFSYIGYTSEEITVGTQSTINIEMFSDITSLGEVVVVGYGTQQRKDVTGAVSSIKGSQIQNLPVAGASQALQGRAAGVNVVRNGGAPGNGGSIRIRGTGTVNNADPLVIIDGIPAGSINDVNPNDIESIEVLKDASSSAIYGTRAANGVVIITTKRGDFGEQLSFSVNGYSGVSNAVNTIDVLDAPTLAQLKRERNTNDGTAINPIWEDPQYQTQRTNWQDELLGTGKVNNLDISLRGGGENSSFMISGGYYDDQGMIQNSYFKRLSLRVNSDHQVGERLRIGQSLQITSQSGSGVNTNSAQTGVLWSAIRFHPGLPVRYEDGTWGSSQVSGEFGDINNPIFTVTTQDARTSRQRLLGNITGEFDITDGLSFKANFGLDATLLDEHNFNIIVDQQIRQSSRNSLRRRYEENYSLLMEYFLNYNQIFAEKHTVNVVAGYTQQTFNVDGFAAQKLDFPDESPSQRYLDVGSTLDNIEGNRTEDALVSWFGRANYNYDERYLLTATFRADGSAGFAEGNKWGYFPAFSAGWRISEEDFFPSNGLIDNLKLTAGWGQLGNQNVDRLQYLALISRGVRYSFGGNQTVGAAQSRIPNADISWETAEMTNVGLEVGMLDNKLSANFNYFIKDTRNMLLAPPTIGSIGLAQVPDQNVGELRNQGLEIELGYNGSSGDLTYSFSANASFIRNEVTRLYDGNFLPADRYGRPNQEIARTPVGDPLSSFYGWRTDGLYQTEQEIESDPNIVNDARRTNGQIVPGDVRFVDINDDGLIDEEDRTILGSPHPDMVYGFNADFGYKGFDLSIFFLGNAGVDIYNADRMQGLDPTYPFNMYAEAINRWNGPGTSNSIPRMTTNRNNLNHRTSDLFIESGDFLRLKNIVIGYTLPATLTEKVGVSRARFYVTGQNVFTITNYSGMDPELGYVDLNGNDNNISQLNVDYAQYPQARTWTVGANITF